LSQRAVMESGPYAAWTARSLSIATTQFYQLATNLNCQGNDMLNCMRSKSWSKILESEICPQASCCYSPTIDGSEIIKAPQQLAKEKKFSSIIPVMVGSNKDEDSIFSTTPLNIDNLAYEAIINTRFPQISQVILRLYPSNQYQSPWHALGALSRDFSFTCPSRRTVRWLTEGGSPSYLYFWTKVINATRNVAPYLGAFHGVEMPFVFDLPNGFILVNFTVNWTPGELKFKETVSKMWKEFAKEGKPSGSWPVYDSTDRNMVLDEEMRVDSSFRKEQCDFWDRLV